MGFGRRGRNTPESSPAEEIARHLLEVAELAGCVEKLRALLPPRSDEEQNGPLALTAREHDLFERMARKRIEQPRQAEQLRRFMADCCIVGEGQRVTGRELFDAYHAWARKHRADKIPMTAISREVHRAGKFGRDPSSAPSGYRRVWTGLGLKRGGADHER